MRVNAHSVVSGAGTLSVRTVQTQKNIVSMHPQIMSMVPQLSGEFIQLSCASLLLPAEIRFVQRISE